ncbi:TlpA disulfide reductase family protein [Hymenobacter sp. DG01]|uniref:TlpA family protein disulfide reductase n=1 Tax=Hymenobacter sp. DG01 TaxID=2584940 RepID=UPI001C5E3C8F|nr:TlpA disulfide reductase family protein [Hymenobacter sp. DG01]
MANYKSGWIFLLWVALLGGCQQKQPKEYRYLIVADIEGCAECKATLWLEDSTIQAVAAAQGRFSMQGKITQPGLYGIYYKSEADKTVSGWVQLYMPTDSIHIKATKKQIRTKFYQRAGVGSYLKNTVVFSTSPQQKEWEQYLLTRDSLWQKFFVDKALVTAKFRETFNSGNQALIAQWADSVRNFDYRASGYWASAADLFVRQHPTSEVAIYAMLDNRNDRPAVERFRQYYQALPKPLQQSFYGQLLDKQLAKNEGRNQNSQRFVGSYVRSLAGKTPTGQELDAAQLFKQNKLTLVEFWASWCGPCRMEMPKYRQLYSQYHSKGFGMIGVSLDNNYNKWVQAIAEDSLRIPHLSELRGGNGEDIQRFGITGIPANLLVDSTGRIVAVDVPYPGLQKKVQQTL